MAWKAYEFIHTNRASVWAAIQAFLVEVGWELHDNISATVKVYKSNGESGTEPYGYIWIDAGTSNYIEFRAYQYWNETAHTGVRPMYAYNNASYSRISYFADASSLYKKCLFCGDKSFVTLVTYADYNGIGQIGQGVSFGHVQYRFDTTLVNVDGTAGTAGTLSVATTSGLGAGRYAQILGTDGNCDLIQIHSVVDAKTVKVVALPRNYGTGSVVGFPASVFGIVGVGNPSGVRFYQPAFYGDSGTTVSGNYVGIGGLSSPAMTTYVSHFNKKWHLTPQFVATDSATQPGITLGMLHENYRFVASYTGYDCFVEMNNGGFPVSGTVSAIGAANELIDERQSWATNENAGKFVLIISGSAIGDLRKIISNTGTVLTLQSDWTTVPDLTADYKIVDIAWRAMPAYIVSTYNLVKITDTKVPS